MTVRESICFCCGHKTYYPLRSVGGFYLRGRFICDKCEIIILNSPTGSRFYKIPLQGVKRTLFS